MTDFSKSVGILGGTFDPVHYGHISIAKSFLNSGYIDSLLILLSPDPPHKTDQNFTDYFLRLKMLKAAFKPFKNLEISDLEYNLPRPSYTVQTMRYLSKAQPDSTFYLCLGKDSFINFKNWYNWQEILSYCDLLVADRPAASEEDAPQGLLKNTLFVNHRPLHVSSSQIRSKFQRKKSVTDLIPAEVLNIMKEANLYRK